MPLTGDLTVARSTSLSLASAGPLGVTIFTPFAYASADLSTVWGESLTGPAFAGITAGTCTFWGVFTLDVAFSGSYDFTAVPLTSASITFSLVAPTSVSTSTYKADVTLTASDEVGAVSESTLTVNQSDVGTNKTITLELDGASVSQISVSASFNITSPFLATTFNIAGFGLNFRQFFITESGGGSGGGEEECLCDWTALSPVPDTAWTHQANNCASFALDPLPVTTWTKRGCP